MSPNEVQVAARRQVRMVFIVEIDFISEGLAKWDLDSKGLRLKLKSYLLSFMDDLDLSRQLLFGLKASNWDHGTF